MLLNNLLTRFLTVFVTLVTFFVLVFIYTKLAGPIPLNVNSVMTSKSDAFSVTGEGKVDVKPDSATVRLGVVSQANTQEEAKNLLNTNINRVIASIKALGVADDKIKTENFNIYPEYNEKPLTPTTQPAAEQDRISGYTANTNISITVNDADLANKIMDVGLGQGANQAGGIDFQVKDKTEALNKAREMAVADAKKKAEDAARIAGFKLGKIINYSEGQNGGYPVPMFAKAEDSRSSAGAPTQVQPGTNEIAITVTLSYEIR
jgi:uncharacterized protein